MSSCSLISHQPFINAFFPRCAPVVVRIIQLATAGTSPVRACAVSHRRWLRRWWRPPSWGPVATASNTDKFITPLTVVALQIKYITTPLHALNTLLILYSLVPTVMRVQDKSVSKLTNIARTGNHVLFWSQEHTLNSNRCRPGNRIVLKMLI